MRRHRRQPTRLLRPWDSPGKNTGVGCHFLLQCMKVKSESEVAQSCPTLSNPMDCSLPGFSVNGIFQARVLEWGATALSQLDPLGAIIPPASLPLHCRAQSFCFLPSSVLLVRTRELEPVLWLAMRSQAQVASTGLWQGLPAGLENSAGVRRGLSAV